MNPLPPQVFVVDDDASVRRSLARLLRSAGYEAEVFPSAVEFLQRDRASQTPACLVLDLRMPGLTGMDLQARLQADQSPLGIVFVTGHGDITTSVRAMKGGAIDFLPKPFDDTELLDAVARALERARDAHRSREERALLQARYATLTAREREVMTLIVTGKPNKQVADALGIAVKTIKIHRARVFEKMAVNTVAELVPIADKLGVLQPGRPSV